MISSRSEFISQLESLLECAREYVPEFSASPDGEGEGEEEAMSEEGQEEGSPSLDIDLLLSKAPKGGSDMFSKPDTPAKKPSLPLYTRRKGE